ncbi:MAG: inositol-3-phosphate synthase [Desulfobacterota bacterium]|nr:inositol-3-phosphate synthase [Thermodesulfobacteriota bacterium]
MQTERKKITIAQPTGKLGILIPGMGAVTTTFLAGLESLRRGLYPPYGSLAQMGHIRLGRRDLGRQPRIKDVVPLARLEDIECAGWDVFPDNCYQAAQKAGVLTPEQIETVKDYLCAIQPMPAVFDRRFVKKLDGPNVKRGKTLWDKHLMLEEDIAEFRARTKAQRLVMIWCGSTEAYQTLSSVHETLEAFEHGLKNNDPAISPSMVYAYTALKNRIPYINGAPHFTTDIPALLELAHLNGVPIAGKDFKTGQTLMKTIIAPGLKARLLGIDGWFSTNILGNRDGEVLEDPESFKSKEVSKLSVLDTILQPELYPELYRNINHIVRINYYPPRGDNKEGWDNIDIFGWMGRRMQIKINFLCRDSILAAPLVLDLILFTDLAQRANMPGIQEWLSFYFKSPMTAPSVYPEHDLFIQLTKLKNTLRYIIGEEMITHLGIEYYHYFE